MVLILKIFISDLISPKCVCWEAEVYFENCKQTAAKNVRET